jgi:hypothetical protein
MNMPGFTAEVSLYQSSWSYSVTGEVVSHESGKNIIPQAPIILDGFCIGNGRYCCFKINGRCGVGPAPRHRRRAVLSTL